MRLIQIICVISMASSVVSADSYTILGTLTYPNNTAVQYEEIVIECEPHAYDCVKFSGGSSMSDFSGGYRMELEFEEGDDGIEVILTVRGERFYHTISIENSSQSNGDYYAHLNLTLAQDPPVSSLSAGFVCGTLFFILVFANVAVRTGRRLMTPEGRQRFQGRSPMPITECRICNGTVRRHLLVRHLIVEHGIAPEDAGALAGLQFSDERSEEEPR